MEDWIVPAVGGLVSLFIAVCTITLPIVFSRLFKSIEAVEGRLTKNIEAVEGRLTKNIEAVEGRLTKNIEAVEGQLTKSIETVEGRLTKSIKAVEDRLTEHEAQCKVRDRDLVGKVNWLMGAMRDHPPETPKPEEAGRPA